MPKINIDALCEPIEVTVGGKTYTVDDISREVAKKMEVIGEQTRDTTDLDSLVSVMSEVLGADETDIAKLGMRKLLLLVTKVMGAINEELVGKNVPEVTVTK